MTKLHTEKKLLLKKAKNSYDLKVKNLALKHKSHGHDGKKKRKYQLEKVFETSYSMDN